MMLAMLLFEAMDAVARWSVSAEMSAIQVIAVRSWLILTLILLVLGFRGEISELTTRRPLLRLGRGLIGFFAPFSFFKTRSDPAPRMATERAQTLDALMPIMA